MLTANQTKSFIGDLIPNDKVLSNSLSKEALEILDHTDFPDRKSELWKYSNTNKIKKGDFKIIPPANRHQNLSFSPTQINICNGFTELAEIKGVDVYNLDTISNEDLNHVGTVANFNRDVFSLMHQAFFQDVLFIRIPSASVTENPIQINLDIEGSNSLSIPRVFICAEESSNSQFVFNIQGGSDKQLHYVQVEIHCEHHAKVDVSLLENGNSEFTLVDVAANLESSANFHINTVAMNGNWLRNNLDISISGEFAHASLNGIVMPSGNQHIDNHTMVHHCVPNCTSSENYKNVVNDSATAIFNGKIMVHPDAQKTNAFQSSSNILLSENATVNAKPELEIYADDVKCSHGSTTGRLNEESLFYLRSRGLSLLSARKLLLKAFAAEVIEGVSIDAVADFINLEIDKKLI